MWMWLYHELWDLQEASEPFRASISSLNVCLMGWWEAIRLGQVPMWSSGGDGVRSCLPRPVQELKLKASWTGHPCLQVWPLPLLQLCDPEPTPSTKLWADMGGRKRNLWGQARPEGSRQKSKLSGVSFKCLRIRTHQPWGGLGAWAQDQAGYFRQGGDRKSPPGSSTHHPLAHSHSWLQGTPIPAPNPPTPHPLPSLVHSLWRMLEMEAPSVNQLVQSVWPTPSSFRKTRPTRAGLSTNGNIAPGSNSESSSRVWGNRTQCTVTSTHQCIPFHQDPNPVHHLGKL